MKRINVLTGLVAVGVLSYAVSQAAQQPAGAAAPKVVEVEKLKDNLFVLKGGGGNTAVFVQAAGITVVDTKNPGWGAPILAKIKELSDKPITTIINTHTHGDHVSGNVEFPATVDVVVQENTAANMKKMAGAYGLTQPGAAPAPSIFDQNGGRGMAKRTFKDHMTLGKGADQIDLYYFGRGHTNGDAWVLFPSLRVAHAGDIFSGKNLPLLDSNNGGSGVEIGNTLAKAHSGLSKSADTIITGHSTQMTMNDLQEYAQFNREFLAAAQEAKKAGKTPEDAAKAWTQPAKYTGYAAAAPARLLANMQVIYAETK
ncbi:MAG: MBL fold metallo-hydrolase [Vicinamibacterales bacterium]|nr:MBL fold metallo-hydrolase [Vicinamibacterales bacterium]